MISVEEKQVFEWKEHGLVTHPGVEEQWSLELFKNNMRVTIASITETLEFDLIFVDCSFANAIRRILMAEVPSVSIERVYLQQNTSVMPDEVLCHRLGLIPLNVDPEVLTFPTKSLPSGDDIKEFIASEHLIFDFKVQFTKADSKIQSQRPTTENVGELNTVSTRSKSVYSSELKWIPLPGQAETFGEGIKVPSPVSTTILINKLAAGDEVEARCLAVKGTGRDHAKYSPVSAAYYKFMPIIRLLRVIEGEEARLLQKSFTPGVIGIDPQTEQAHVINSRLDNGSREHMRHPEFRDDSLFVSIDPSHCIFFVESIAPDHRSPDGLVRSAFDVMLGKCEHYLAIVDKPDFVNKITEGPSFERGSKGDQTASEGVDSSDIRSQFNGREVGLEVTHISQDKRRVTYTFYGEDHTLGLALRFCVLQSTNATFCGYCVPHPLEDKIHFDVQVKNGSAHDAFRAGLQCLRDCFSHMKSAFKNALKAYKKKAKQNI